MTASEAAALLDSESTRGTLSSETTQRSSTRFTLLASLAVPTTAVTAATKGRARAAAPAP